MSYRGGKGRYSTRSGANDQSYTSPVYSTPQCYQPAASNTSRPFTNNAGYKTPQNTSAADKQEYKPSVKTEDLEQTTGSQDAQAPLPAQTTDTPMAQDGANEKPWKRKNFVKLPKKVKKKRLNAKLRNILAPKNAMMVLHELHPGLIYSTKEETGGSAGTSYTVSIEIDGKIHKGQGLSKAQAKQIACENALKASLLERMAESSAKQAEAMDTSESDVGASPNGEGSEGKGRRVPEEDCVPWGSLASFALFKLFSDWQAQGYSLPATPGKPQGLAQSTERQAPHQMPMKKVPIDAAQRHPVQLLSQLKPLAQFSETREGSPPNMVFTFTVKFEEQTFTGVGPNKKDAKKSCAKNALMSLGIQYND